MVHTTYSYTLLGDSGVGKTALWTRFRENRFVEVEDTTAGVEVGDRLVVVKEEQVKIQTWDTSGLDTYRSLALAHCRRANVIVLVYDVTRRDTFSGLCKWLSNIREHSDANTKLLLVGNKCDLYTERQVPSLEGEEFARTRNIPFFETSAKTNKGIEDVFVGTVQALHVSEHIDEEDLAENESDSSAGGKVDEKWVEKKGGVAEEDAVYNLLAQLPEVERAQVQSLRAEVRRLRDEKLALFSQLREQSREIEQQRHRIGELEQALTRAGLRVGGSPPRPGGKLAKKSSLCPAPNKAPEEVTVMWDEAWMGTALILSEDKCELTATHQYNKMCLTTPSFDSFDSAYLSFTLVGEFAKFTAVGIVMEAGIPRLNVNTDSLGEHDFSYAWCGHPYWTSCLVNNGVSKGPKGGMWKPGSQVGVLVHHGALSLYVDGTLAIPHAFHGLTGRYRFAVGFGGTKSPDGSYGSIRCGPSPPSNGEGVEQDAA